MAIFFLIPYAAIMLGHVFLGYSIGKKIHGSMLKKSAYMFFPPLIMSLLVFLPNSHCLSDKTNIYFIISITLIILTFSGYHISQVNKFFSLSKILIIIVIFSAIFSGYIILSTPAENPFKINKFEIKNKCTRYLWVF